ncbi:unnamed protein product, partial [Protopolystoma xenopodis]
MKVWGKGKKRPTSAILGSPARTCSLASATAASGAVSSAITNAGVSSSNVLVVPGGSSETIHSSRPSGALGSDSDPTGPLTKRACLERSEFTGE